ncbi:hypothetical protein ACFS27_27170 [Promicromonospora vindobonensis]|uniref:PH (Pleckstrin Homology) domain-containing protein n=1 Tax=Promicromonospora vindobonensis TaxID=195748 RepID=A0ABW5W1C4_9MICO
MIALVAAIIWMASTYANPSNTWDPVNFVLRIAAGALTIAAVAEWLVLSVRESRGARPRTRGSHVASGVRRSAGSRGVLDNLLASGRATTPAQDLAIVTSGGAVLVVAYLMERKVRRVSLRVGLDDASVASLEAVLGAAPHRVFGTQPPARGVFDRSAYTQLEGASRSGAWSVAVPTADVDLLRYVLARAEEIR